MLWIAVFVAALPMLPDAAFGQTANPAAAASAPAASKAGAQARAKIATNGPFAATLSKPTWSELSPIQQQALKPLAQSWNAISEPQKRKWLEISKNYPALAPADQATMHSRMNEWVSLSPQQRMQARLNFAKTKELSKQLTPDEKKAKWDSYQALSPEEKQKLAANSAKTVGAAPAVKPVAPQKLAVIRKNASAPASPAAGHAASSATDGATGSVSSMPKN